MRIHGFCETCNKIKLVPATSAGMVRLAMNQPIFGQCDACRDAEIEKAQSRHPSRRGRVPRAS